MVLSSGVPPYEYVTTLPFRVGNPYIGQLAIGPSGILLEQAQFVITAELRRFNRLVESHILPEFNLYTNFYGPNLGPYEPCVDGRTLASSGAIGIIDHIEETRDALELLFREYADDTDFGEEEHKADWLQQAYPTSPSGFYLAPEFNVIGQYTHRSPSEVGLIDYISEEVLGGSGVLYDVDFGEVMFNPYPYMSVAQAIDARGRRVNGILDPYNVLGSPIFPSFQRTDGTLIDLNGFEPVNPVGLHQILTDPISSGAIRLDGYCLRENTDYRLGSFFDFNQNLDFLETGIRSFGFAGNLDTGRVYTTVNAASSGVYQVLARNTKASYPNGAVVSGAISIWPRQGFRYYGTNVENTTDPSNTADEDFNSGYHVFDETIWCTDRTQIALNLASGLAVLSPWTGHQLWLRYAESDASPLGGSWGRHRGLERSNTNNIFRVHSASIAEATALQLQTYTFHKYDDLLNYLTDVTSDGNPNTTRGAGGEVAITDLFYDNNHFFTLGAAGSGMVEFDGSFNYVSSWAVTSNVASPALSGCGSRAFFGNSKYYFYIPQQPGPGDPLGQTVGGLNMRSSGIIEFAFTAGNRLDLVDIKYVRGEKIFGSNIPPNWTFHDIIEVASSPHLTPGIWLQAAIRKAGELVVTNYLMRIEEKSDYWEIVAFMRLDTGSQPDSVGSEGTVDILYMPI